MSDFIQQWHIECAFRSSDSWVILSPIEQSIKRKIEAVGTPLKNWNININYGIKTGYNDAFIINTERERKYYVIVERKMSAKERLNLYDRFFAAEILRDTDTIGQDCGLLLHFRHVITILKIFQL